LKVSQVTVLVDSRDIIAPPFARPGSIEAVTHFEQHPVSLAAVKRSNKAHQRQLVVNKGRQLTPT
jgi:hypothetical protein